MCSLINKQLLLTAYAYLFIMEQQKGQQGSEALQVEMKTSGAKQAEQAEQALQERLQELKFEAYERKLVSGDITRIIERVRGDDQLTNVERFKKLTDDQRKQVLKDLEIPADALQNFDDMLRAMRDMVKKSEKFEIALAQSGYPAPGKVGAGPSQIISEFANCKNKHNLSTINYLRTVPTVLLPILSDCLEGKWDSFAEPQAIADALEKFETYISKGVDGRFPSPGRWLLEIISRNVDEGAKPKFAKHANKSVTTAFAALEATLRKAKVRNAWMLHLWWLLRRNDETFADFAKKHERVNVEGIRDSIQNKVSQLHAQLGEARGDTVLLKDGKEGEMQVLLSRAQELKVNLDKDLLRSDALPGADIRHLGRLSGMLREEIVLATAAIKRLRVARVTKNLRVADFQR